MTFKIPGAAVPKARPRVGRSGAYTPKKSAAYQNKVSALALKARQIAHLRPYKGNVSVDIEVWGGSKRIDIDNVAKNVLDGMTGVCYRDDCQVQLLVVERYECEQPHVNVTVEER